MFGEMNKSVISDPSLLTSNIGPELWIENPDLKIRTTLWSDKEKKPLMVNINASSVYEIASFKNFDVVMAREFIKKRDELGYFTSMEEALKFGFKF